MKGAGAVVLAVVMMMISFVVQPGQAVSCGQIDSYLAPCIPFLTGHGGDPSPACCAGVREVKGLAQTTADKRAACACVKAAAIRYTDLKDEAAQSLPTKCSVVMDIPVSRTVDCDKITLLDEAYEAMYVPLKYFN